MSIRFTRSILTLLLGILVAFTAAHAHEIRAADTTPLSSRLKAYVEAVGADGDIVYVSSLADDVVQLHGHAADPARVLAKLSASPLLHSARLEPQVGESSQRLPAFVVTASLANPAPDLRTPGFPSAQASEIMLERVHQVLDDSMPGTCDLISTQNRTANVDAARSLSLMLRLRCGGTLEQLAGALSEIERGAPAMALSALVIYPRAAMEAPAPASQLDLRMTATGLLQ